MNSIVTNERGGQQSKLEYRLLDFDARALLRVARVSATGCDRYGPGNWQLIDQADHLEHALVHVLRHLAGDRAEDHLAHATCRLLFALGVEGQGQTAMTMAQPVETERTMAAESVQMPERPTKPLGGRPSQLDEWLKPEKRQQVRGWFMDGVAIRGIAKRMGVPVGTLYTWRSRSAEFAALFKPSDEDDSLCAKCAHVAKASDGSYMCPFPKCAQEPDVATT